MEKKILLFVLSLCITSCVLKEEEKKTSEYSSLKLIPAQDTLFMNANGESAQFSLEGTLVNTSDETMKNSGVMTDVQYTVHHTDTVYQSVNNSEADWLTSNSSVATVSNGLVTPKSSGYATITARIGNTTSAPMVVNVRSFASPSGGTIPERPGLSLDPPDYMLIFEDHTTVSGTVQTQAVLSVSESNSGFLNSNVSHSQTGKFSLMVTGLQQGLSIITARASHPNDATLYTERSKTVVYYAPNSSQANGILGNWLGTTLGQNFNFSITNSVIPTRYDIVGKIDIKFEGIGWVRDIDLIGLVNNNGTIDVNLSKTFTGGSVSGKLNGYFKDTGHASGEYSAQFVKTGWPKISFNEKWTAVKVP